MLIKTNYTHKDHADLFEMEDELGQTVTIEYRNHTETPAYRINAAFPGRNGTDQNIYHDDLDDEEFDETYPENPTKDQLFHIAANIYINAVKHRNFANVFHDHTDTYPVRSHFCSEISDEIAALFEEIN